MTSSVVEPGVDEDGLVLGDQRRGVAPDQALFPLGQVVLLVEEFLQAQARGQHGAAARALQQVLPGQRVEIAADGDLGDAEFGRQLVGRDGLALVEHFQDLLVAIVADLHRRRLFARAVGRRNGHWICSRNSGVASAR